MILPDKIARVQIITHKKWKKEIVEALYSLGVLHIKDYVPGEFEISKPLEEAEEVSRILLKLRNVLSKLPSVESKKEKKVKTRRELEKMCESVNRAIEKIISEQKDVENEIRKVKKYLEIKAYLDVLGVDANSFWESKTVSIISGIVKKFDESEINGKGIIMLKHGKAGEFSCVYIVVKKKQEEEVRKALAEMGFVEFDYSLIREFANINAEQEIRKLKRRKKELEREMSYLAKEYRKTFEIWKNNLEEEAEKAEAPLKFAESRAAVFIEGWVPMKESEKIINAVKKITGNKAFVKIEEVKRKEEAPVKLSHPKPVGSFKSLLEMYSLPRYGEIDPTLFMFITFPIYFGFMLGDIGYGIVILAIALLMRKKVPGLKDFSNILLLASASSIFFGFLYGEFFGAEKLFGVALPHVISRLHSINELLIASVIFGLIHINTGLVLGFINEYMAHGIKAAVFEKGSWLVVELGGLLFFFYWKGMLNIDPVIPGTVFIIGTLMLMKGEGFIGVVELPTLLSHILSYSRLMGVGVASASLAMIINELSGNLLAKGIIFLPVVAIMLMIGHTVNIILGLLECSLHSLRLNWVEFFTKFYKGGGIPYTPFGKNLRGE